MKEQVVSNCMNYLRCEGVSTQVMSWSEMERIAKAMVKFACHPNVTGPCNLPTESKRLLTIKTSDGYSESIVIPNDEEETIKKAINKIHTENYVDSHCVDWRYNDGYGSYFDQVIWKDVTIDVAELRVL